MTTLTDTDYVLQLVRLHCLRQVADPLLPSVITFPDSHSPHVYQSTLLDPSVWPELVIVRPPEPVAAQRSVPQGGLKYSDTIVGTNGHRVGAGIRVAGRERSRPEWLNQRRASMAMEGSDVLARSTEESERKRANSLPSPAQPTTNSLADLVTPVVTIESPIDTPDRTPSPSGQKAASRLSRPVTYLHDSVSKQDKEISDALRWQTDGPSFEEDNPVVPVLNGDQSHKDAAPPSNDAVQSPLDPPETPVEEEFTAASQVDTSPSTTVDGDSYALLARPRGDDDYDLVSATNSVLEASSFAARQSRTRLRRKRSELELATPQLQQVDEEQRDSAQPKQTADPVPKEQEKSQDVEPPKPVAPLAIRRERRRVNISGRFFPMQQLQATGLPPIHEPAEHAAASPVPTAEPAVPNLQPTTANLPQSRARADTDPKAISAAAGRSLPRQSSDSGLKVRSRASSLQSNQGGLSASAASLVPRPSSRSASPLLSFPIQPLQSLPKAASSSTLTTMLSQKPAEELSDNPFSSLYAAVIVRGAGVESLALSIFFPSSNKPSEPIAVKVKKDVTVEEVIGASLWHYYEEKREPPLLTEEEQKDWDGVQWRGRCNPAAWVLRIVEDEQSGEVDDDFPAIDRTRKASAFAYGAFAMVEATASEFKQNAMVQNTIARRPSRMIARRTPIPTKRTASSPQANALNVSARTLGATGSDPDLLQSSMIQGTPLEPHAPGSSYVVDSGEQVYLRIRIPIPGLQAVVTTLKVTTQTYLADVLESLVKKRKEHLQDTKDWVLMLGDRDIIAPTDRTIESLQGNYNLRLVKRSDISNLLKGDRGNLGRPANTNPTASIFKRVSEPLQPQYVTAAEIAGPKSWIVSRKHTVTLGRHERVLTIYDDYISLTHHSTNAAQSASRTITIPIREVRDCKQSRKDKTCFKLVVEGQGGPKRYDFGAEKPETLHEITAAINAAMQQARRRNQG